MISKKEKKIYFALESIPASHLFPIKASSKRLSMKREVELGEREKEERRDRVCGCVCLRNDKVRHLTRCICVIVVNIGSKRFQLSDLFMFKF